MDRFLGNLRQLDGLPQFLTLGILAISAIYVFSRLFKDPELGLVYHVDEPEQLKEGWKGEVLEDASLKVGIHSIL